VGYNYRMTNLQAAIGVAQFERIDHFIERKAAVEQRYRQALAGVPGLTFMAQRPDVANVCWLFSLVVDQRPGGQPRDDLMSALAEAGVDTRPLFFPLHSMPLYGQYAANRGFPNADWLSANGLSLPSAVTFSDAEIDYVCRMLVHLLVERPRARALETLQS
jgi:perosamine synthetase